MTKKELIIEGKSKKIFQTPDQNEIIIEYKDDITAFNNKKHDILESKGKTCAAISKELLTILNAEKIKTHFIKAIDETHHLCRKIKMIPLEVVLRNFATGRICRDYPIQEWTKFDSPIIEFFYKNDHDPLITDDLIYFMKIVDEKQLNKIKETTFKINEILSNLFKKIGIKLIDFKIEYGIDLVTKEIIIGDEVSPDSMRLINIDDNRKLDKELYRQSMGNVMECYKEVLRKITNGLHN